MALWGKTVGQAWAGDMYERSGGSKSLKGTLSQKEEAEMKSGGKHYWVSELGVGSQKQGGGRLPGMWSSDKG